MGSFNVTISGNGTASAKPLVEAFVKHLGDQGFKVTEANVVEKTSTNLVPAAPAPAADAPVDKK
jgi:hypothetical protein